MRLPHDLFLSSFGTSDSALPLRIEHQLLERLDGQAIRATSPLDLDEYERLELCRRELLEAPHAIVVHRWGGEDYDRLIPGFEQAHWRVAWREMSLQVVSVSWQTPCGGDSRMWIVGDRQETVDEFILDVSRRTNDPGESILVFHGGGWQRSRELYQATQSASFDDLVLSGSLKDAIRADFRQFLDARQRYESLGVAWRRGALLIGPPGNGKTHCVRALVKELQIPSLYVQSLSSQYYTSEQMLMDVFERARRLHPCILILEDIDALVTAENQSFFLNQLDGFERNVGLMVIATTNHPDRIDPAILDRPSRFDRKYHFALPEADERRAFLQLWQAKLAAETGWSADSIESLLDVTAGFSFAYLKEMVVSGVLRWMAASESPSPFIEVLRAQGLELRAQMATKVVAPASGGA